MSKSAISKKQFEQNLLINSRLVNEQEDKVDFTLPIFREFYAARAIIEETISIDSTMPVSDRWLIPMAIVMEEDEERGYELINKLVSSDPGFASLLMKDLVSRWDDQETGTISLGTTKEVGQKIWTAMDAWRQGLGKLFSVIGPVSPNGGTATLGINIIGNYRVITAWYRGTNLPSVVTLPENMNGETQNENWHTLSFGNIPYTAYWPWIWTKKFLVHTLSESIKSNRLILGSKDAVRELVWDFSCNVYKFSAVELTEISVREILHFIEKLQDSNTVQFGYFNGVQFRDREIKSIKSHLMELLENDVDTISAPWPSADKTMPSSSGSILDYYSEQRLLDLTNDIYTAALSIYQITINQWFGPFDKQLDLIRPRPAKLEGGLVLPDRQDVLSIDPILTRVISPLSAGEESIATFKIMSQEKCNEFIKSHIETREFWSYSSGILQPFGSRPATEIACKWLIDDLRKLGWAGHFH